MTKSAAVVRITIWEKIAIVFNKVRCWQNLLMKMKKIYKCLSERVTIFFKQNHDEHVGTCVWNHVSIAIILVSGLIQHRLFTL